MARTDQERFDKVINYLNNYIGDTLAESICVALQAQDEPAVGTLMSLKKASY